MDSTKRCSLCGEEKPIEDFSWLRKSEGTRQSKCKPCATAVTKQWYKTERSKPTYMWRTFRDSSAVLALQCFECRLLKHPSEFYKRGRGRWQRPCKRCLRANAAQWGAENVERLKFLQGSAYSRRSYGLNYTQFLGVKAALLEAQGNGCAICGKPMEASAMTQKGAGGIFLDHSHATGKLRGVLCYGCNSGLGSFRDNPEFLRAAIKYLIANDESLQ